LSRKLKVHWLPETLKTTRFGRRILFSKNVDSTNDWAKQLANYGAEEGTVAVAETQSCGRGRLARDWISPVGGLWFSIVLRPKTSAADAAKLVFVVSLAVAKVLDKTHGLKTETKWPNDVLVGGRKVCGILAEMKTAGNVVDFVVVGIGVNANFNVEDALPAALKNTATSLRRELGREVSLGALLRVLLEKIEWFYDRFVNEGFGPILNEWKKYANFLGHKIEVTCLEERASGVALDVDNDGALILRLEDGVVARLFAGDISLRMKE
jgi:BirA family biotin operon repressor/biotin-[acetyl-CoA-carboxylase] ligase